MSSPTAERGLTVAQGAALTIGAVLGTGVISLPSLAAGMAGPASLVAWLALVLLSIPLAGTFAALGARHPDGGGVSTYVRRAFGRRAATAVGWVFYFAIPVGAPPAAMFAGGYVADTFGGGRTMSLATGGALILAVAAMNAYGVRISGRVQLALTAVLAALLLVTMITALPHAQASNLTPFAPHGWSAVGSAAALLVWGFAGWEAVTSLSGDYRQPRRDIPRATGIAVLVVGVLYLGVVVASILVLGSAAGSSAAPLADLLAIAFGGPARGVTTVVAVLLTVGAVNAYFAGGARLGAALGRDGALPAWFARGSTAGEVPRRSLGFVTVAGHGVARGDRIRARRPACIGATRHRLVHAGLRPRYGGSRTTAAARHLGVRRCNHLARRGHAAAGPDRGPRAVGHRRGGGRDDLRRCHRATHRRAEDLQPRLHRARAGRTVAEHEAGLGRVSRK